MKVWFDVEVQVLSGATNHILTSWVGVGISYKLVLSLLIDWALD